MNQVELLNFLEKKCSSNEITLRYEKGDFDGGFCILRDSQVLVINKKLTENRKIIVLTEAMEKLGIDKKEFPLDVQLQIETEFAK